MSFVSDELAKALKSAYMVEESERREGVYSSSKVDKKCEDFSKEKRPRKHKHRKHTKSKSKDRKKNKKRKRKSRSPSRSRSESRSKSRSRSSEREISFKSKERGCRTSKSRSKSPKKTRTSFEPDGEFVSAKERKVDELPEEGVGEVMSGSKEMRIDLKQGSMSTLLLNASDELEKESESQDAQEKDKLKSPKGDTGSAKTSGSCNTSLHFSNAEKKLGESNGLHQSEGCKKDISQSRSQSEERSDRKRSSSVSSKASDVEVSNLKKTSSSSKSRSVSKDISKEEKSSPKAPFKELSITRNSQPRSHSKNHSKKEKSRTKSPSNGQPGRGKKSRSSSCSYHKESRSRSKSHSQNKRSHSKSLKESESRSRSRDKRSQSRSRSRSKSYSKRKRSRSKSRSRSRHKRSHSRLRSHSRHKRRDSRSRSHSRSYRRYKSRSRSRSRRKRSCSNPRRRSPTHRHYQKVSPLRKRNVGSSRRWLSRSPSRPQSSPSRGRHKARSSSGPERSRSRSYSRSRSRSWSRRRRSRSTLRGSRRSRSRSFSRVRGRKSASQDRQKDRNKTKLRSKSKEKTVFSNTLTATRAPSGIKTSSVIDKPVATEMTGQQSKIAARSGGKTIAELTAFCQKLADEKEDAKSALSSATGVVKEDSPPVTHHPFLLKEKPDVSIPPVIFPVKHQAVLSIDANKPLQEVFPVSCGSKHRENEVVNHEDGTVPNIDGSATIQGLQKSVFEVSPAEKFDISELVAKRMEAQRRLETNPNDIESMLTLQEIQMKMQNWCQSNVKPGQFTGELVKSLLPKEDLNGGYQAWAKKDMFQNLAPVTGGIGMKLLQKMGWRPGQVIGKRGEGFAEPIPLTVKIDRKGLSTVKEKPTKKATTVDLQGKHPVSALAEFCSKRKWQLPDYSLVFDHGPAHSKQFLFKVLVNGTEYQPAVVCGNKKQAKAQAAIFALKGLGLIPEDTEISAM